MRAFGHGRETMHGGRGSCRYRTAVTTDPPTQIDRRWGRGLHRDTVAQVLRTFGERRSWLVGLIFNLIIGFAYAWYTAYSHGHHVIPRTAGGIAANMAMFVLSDTINTNQLGADRDQATSELRRGINVTRLLFTRNVALTVLLLPLTMIVAAGFRWVLGEDRTILAALALDTWVVIGWLALGNLASVLFPYWPMPLKQRRRAPRTWLWWGWCLFVPYGLYYLRAWFIEPFVDHLLGRHALLHADRDWAFGLRFVGAGVVMLLISYAVCALIGTQRKWLISRLELDH